MGNIERGCESGKTLKVEISDERLGKLLDKLKIVPETMCVNWCGSCTENGYGQVKYRGKYMKTHRFFYSLLVSEIPPKLQVLHKSNCKGNRKCCNPQHLYLGNHKQNMIDRDNDGATAKQKGESHGLAKLSEKDIYRIWEKWHDGYSLKYIVESLDNKVAESQISRITQGLKWGHLKLIWDKSIRKQGKLNLKKSTILEDK